ncbi:regulator of G-protein signaling loco-like isoform X2 [Tigriopus californicus]|uniref:regulator of G-protein signaling loco-like isoform X2 n=1 Tax=Tigriopus californicus TaxID=6832 RepID=UPI0027DA7022|nr:regulator of G-protein signaling loco-like isoform X2 [Tigriopus californicus]
MTRTHPNMNEKLGWSSRGSSVRKHLVRRSLSSSKIDQLGQDSEETSWPPTSKTRVKGENKENDVVITDELDENSSQNGSLASDRGVDIGRVGMWATDFEKLLHDPVGLQTFTEFLKKEFSAENIFFWVACERYRHLENESERHTAAIQIMDRHLSAGAPDPVNVDSHARQAAQDGMATTTPTMFNLAQKQIYNLMKFDSFSRFLKSELYKESLLAEMSGNPLPFANDLEAPLTEKSGEESKGSSKEKSSLSWGKKSSKADVENRRRSLLPWGNLRGKDRSKSKERSIGESELRAAKSMTLVPSQGQHKLKAKSRDDLSQSSRASLTSADVSKLSNNSRDSSLSHNADCEGCTLARVILPDKATTVVQTRNQETIRAMVSRLLDKRGLKYTSFDVFAPNLDKPLDLSEDCSTLGCTEVRVEPRVLFRLELPSKKSIGVKAKPAKIVKDVLGPILSQYGWNLDEMRVKLDSSRIDIDLEDTVQSIDNSRLVVTGRMPTEEVNSRLFEDMMRSKRPHNNGLDDQRSVRTDSSTESSTRIYKKVPGGDTEKQSMPPPERIPMKRGGGGSAFAKPKNANGPPSSAAILKNTGVTEELYEGLKLAQRGRLDDQRGTEINFEMPDFLKRGDANPRPNQGKENSHPFQSPLSHRQSEPIISNHRLDVFPPDPRLSTISSNNFYSQIENDYHTLNHPNHPSPFGRPPRDSFYVHNRSNDSNFSQEGYLPNSSEADRFFNLSNHSGEFSSGQFNESRVSLGFGNTPYRRGASTQPHHSLPPQSLEPPQNLYETLSHYKSGWNTPGTSLPPMADPTMLMRREPPPLPPKPKFGRMGRPNGVSSEIDMPMHQAPQHQQHQQQQQQQQQPRGYSVSFV